MKKLFILLTAVFISANGWAEEVKPKIIQSHALVKHGQPKYPEGFERFDYTSPNAVKGGEVTIAETGSYDSLNYFIQKGVAERNATLIYDSLMVSSADEPKTFYGLIAQSIEYPSDQSWIIFNLNPKAYFADGKPITADDVAFSFNTLINDGDPFYKTYFKDVDEITVLAKHKIKFSIKNPDNKEMLQGIASLPVFPKHFWADKSFAKSGLTPPLGSGAYKIEKFDAGRSITYVRDDNYWAKDLNVNKGLYNYDKINVEYFRDMDVGFEAFKSGVFDYRYELISKTWAIGYDIPHVKSGKIKRLEFDDTQAKGISGIFYNLRKPYLQNRALRQAMGMAFDFEWVRKNIFYGSYSRTQSFFENTQYKASGTPSPAELALLNPFKKQLPKDVFGEAYKAPVTDGSGNNRKQLRAAKQLLTAAGYTIEQGKLIDPTTKKPIELEFIIAQATLERVLNPWIANVKKLGITINLRLMDVAQYSNRMQTFDYELTWTIVPGIDIPGNEQTSLWGSEAADIESSANYLGLKNPAVDSLLKALNAVQNDEQRAIITSALDRILTHSHYITPLYHSKSNRIAYWDKFGIPKQHPTYDFRHGVGFYTWWIDPEKEKQLNAKK